MVQQSPGSLQKLAAPIFPKGGFSERAHGILDRMSIDPEVVGDIEKPHMRLFGEERIHFTQEFAAVICHVA